MRLIIDIPDWYYAETKEFKHPILVDNSIINGIQFDPFIEGIRAEIEHKADNSNGSICDGLYDALKIMDRHIAEVKEGL